MVRIAQYLEASKTNKGNDIKTAVLSPTRWFFANAVGRPRKFQCALLIYLLIREFLYYLTTVSIAKAIPSICKVIYK